MNRFIRFAMKFAPEDWRKVVGICMRLNLVNRWIVARLIGLSVITVLTDAFGLFIIFPILQFVANGRDLAKLASQSKAWAFAADVSAGSGIPINLLSLCFTVFLLICIRQFSQYAFSVYLAYVQATVGRELRIRVFNAIMRSQGARIDALGSGGAVQSIIYSAHYGGTAIASLARVTVVLLSFAIYSAGLLVVTPAVTLIAGAAAAFLGLLTRYFRKVAAVLNQDLIKQNTKFIQFISERYRAWRLVKLSVTTELESERFSDQARSLGVMIVAINRNSAAVQVVVMSLGALLMLSGLYIAVEFFSLTVAELTLFALVYLRIMPLTNTILNGRQQMATIYAHLSQAEIRLRESQREREIDTGTTAFVGVEKGIHIEDVRFKYSGQTTAALNGVRLKIPARTLTALIGPSGGGKSTLIDLLPRIIVPLSGRVLIDGIQLDQFSLDSLRRGIAFVAQTPMLFSGSIEENLRYGKPDATKTELDRACQMAFVDEFILELPERYNTVVGESGYTLSGGQRQRIALARAFLRGCSLLILDEPTSALDHHSEQRIKQAIQRYRELYDATVIIIAHRLSTIQSAEHVIVLKKGKVVEEGPPQALTDKGDWLGETVTLENT